MEHTLNMIKLTATKFKKMEIKPIKNEQDYFQALQRLEIIFDAKPGTKVGDELEILGILLEKYENENSPLNFLIQLKP